MSNDLVKRLRESGSRSEVELHEDREEAADRIEELEAKLFRLERVNDALEELRPVWGQGYTNDSMAAQATANALSQLWGMLNAKDQTHACGNLRQQQARIEELEAKLAKAVSRLDKLIYWLDIDDELWDAFTIMEKSDHRHMQSEVQTIKDILTGGKDE